MSAVQPYRVILAHGDPTAQRRISDLLTETKQFQVVFTTHSGEACIAQALSSQPDLVIADTLLSGADGLEVLRQVKLHCPNTRVLLLTSYHILAHHRVVVEVADYCIVAPYSDQILVARALELLQPLMKERFDPHLVVSQTAAYLSDLGAPLRLKGYLYISDGTHLSVLDPDVIHHHAGPNGLYAQLCRRHNETYRNVERCMRTVTDHIFQHTSLSVLETYFTPADLARGRITNITLISTLAEKVAASLREMQARQVSSSF